MPLYYRKRAKLTRTVTGNLTKTGASLSTRVGPITVNSRGRVTVRVLPRLFFRLFR
jgi:hypothetical protein